MKHITQFIKYYRSNNSIGQLLRITLRWIRHVAGLSICPLQNPTKTYHHIPDPWFNTTIRFLCECRANIETNDYTHSHSRKDDSHLMDDFFLFNPTRLETIHLNQCRLFLRATTLSDIATTDGHTILRSCWDGNSCLNSDLLWPIQQKPSGKAWRTWRSYITKCYLSDDDSSHVKRTDLTLQTPLGPWLPTHHQLTQREFYINPTTYTIYRRHHNTLLTYRPVRTTRTLLELLHTGQTNTLPAHTHPIEPTVITNTTLRISKQQIDKHYPSPPVHEIGFTSFNDYVNSLPTWKRELIQHFNLVYPTINTITHLQENFLIATDGSEQNAKGSFGWVLSTESGSIFASGQGTAFGAEISSFRCEAYGILAALQFIIILRHYYHIPHPNNHVIWWCDCRSLITQIKSNHTSLANPNRHKLAEHDLECAICYTLPLVSVNIKFAHLKSHQYDNLPLHSLPLPYRLNRIADKLAQDHNLIMTHPMETVPLIHQAACQLHIQGKTITRSLANNLHRAYTYESSITHLTNRLTLHSTYRNLPEHSTLSQSDPNGY